jgi:type III restriction enzyme
MPNIALLGFHISLTFEDLDVPLKMARLRQWCEDINKAQSGVTYDFVFVDQNNFDKYKLKSFRELTETFREYKNN